MANPYVLAIGVRAQSDKLRGDLANVGKMFRNVLVGISGAFATRALATQFQTVAEDIDRVAKSAQKLGADVDSVIQLEHAANLSGIAVGELEAAMRKNLDVLSSAANSGAGKKGVFAELGLDAAALTKMGLDQRILAIGAALEQVANPGDRVRIAMDLFGKAGANLLPLFSQGAAGLRAAMEEAKLLGLTVGSASAQVEAANDAMSRLSAVGTGVWRQMVIVLAPVIEQLATGLLPTLRTVGQYFVEVFASAGAAGTLVLPVIGAINNSLAMMMNVLTGARGLWQILQAAIQKLFSWLEAGIGKLLKLLPESFGFGDIGQAAEDLSVEFGDAAAKSFTEGTARLGDAFAGGPGERFLQDVEALRAQFDAVKAPDFQLPTQAEPSNMGGSAAQRQFPESLLRGTMEAATRALKLEFGGQGDDVPKAQLAEQQETNQILAKLERRGVVLAAAEF